MYNRNDGKGYDNVAQNRFTAYLMVALRNARKQYLEKQCRIYAHEVPFEMWDGSELLVYEPDLLANLPVMEQLEYAGLQASLQCARERDLHLLMGRIIEGKSLRELADELNIGYHTASTAYHRLIRRLRRELDEDGDWI